MKSTTAGGTNSPAASRRPQRETPGRQGGPRKRAVAAVREAVARGLPVVQAARRVALALGRGGSPGLRGYRRTASARSNRHGRTHRPPPAGAGSVVNRCGGGWSAVADAPSAPNQPAQAPQRDRVDRARYVVRSSAPRRGDRRHPRRRAVRWPRHPRPPIPVGIIGFLSPSADQPRGHINEQNLSHLPSRRCE